jgi:sugar/nucleoside kinase (ribokinase family)
MFAGVLGYDELSSLVTDRLAEEGIDLSHVTRQANARPIHSFIVVEIERATRTILFDPSGTAGAPDSDAVVQLVLASRVLFVDPYGVPGMIRAATAARAAGIPVVGDFEGPVRPDWPPLLELVDHLIVSTDFATELTAESDPARAVEALLTDDRDTVIVTCGVEGSWCLTHSSRGRPMHVPAYRVKAVDTNGCGDVFHGAYASALAQGMGTRERIVFATAAAALKATRSGGQAGIPRRDEVEAFIHERAT